MVGIRLVETSKIMSLHSSALYWRVVDTRQPQPRMCRVSLFLPKFYGGVMSYNVLESDIEVELKARLQQLIDYEQEYNGA